MGTQENPFDLNAKLIAASARAAVRSNNMQRLTETPSEHTDAPLPAHIWAIFWIVLGCTLAASLAWSHQKLFWTDELLEYYSDVKPTCNAVLLGQLYFPFSLEPPAFHLLLHETHNVLSRYPELAARLPSILSLLVTEICSFVITLRLTKSPTAALAAMAGPFFLTTIDYAPEARVYSMLTALFALSILCYQKAIQSENAVPSRTPSLLGLALSLGGAILLHYYGILLTIPFLAGELFRTLHHKRFDWPTVVALLAAMSVFALNLPFMRPLHEIQAHYYDTGETSFRMIPFTYLWLVNHSGVYRFDLLPFAKLLAHLANALITIGVLALIVGTVQWLVTRWRTDPDAPVMVVLLGGFLLPVVNLLVAHYVTHAYAPRYSLPACVSMSVLAIALWKRHSTRVPWLCFLLVTLSVTYTALHTAKAHERRVTLLSNLIPTPQLRIAIEGQKDEHVYIQDTARFLSTYYYASPGVKQQLMGVSSADREFHWLNRDPSSIFARNINRTTNVPWVRYETLVEEGGSHLFVIYNDPTEEWITQEIASGAASAQICGPAFGGTLYRVSFK